MTITKLEVVCMRQYIKYYILSVISRFMYCRNYLNGQLCRIFSSNSICGLYLITRTTPICFPNSERYIYIDLGSGTVSHFS